MTEKEYYSLIDEKGLKDAWAFILTNNIDEEKWIDLYEKGLAYTNKIEKKEMGKYYTPIDVANVMASFLLDEQGENLCDVCCGAGNLILEVLKSYSFEQARDIIKNKKIYLYDIDEIALNICRQTILNTYGEDLAECLNIICGNFLDESIHLPQNSKVISNPPYGKMSTPYVTIIQNKTKDLYSAFMEKIINEAKSSIIITPHSFLNGTKFDELRKLLDTKQCEIYSFDNVPGNIFNGKKLGIFNSNNTNSVRASISIIREGTGIYLSEFIRFKNDERKILLNKNYLKNLLSHNVQHYKKNMPFFMLKNDAPITWLNNEKTIESLLAIKSEFPICVPKTCRYFTVGTKKDLNRVGKYILYAKDKKAFYLLYAILNSSYCYYWYRACNGGITYPITLLKKCPIPNNNITNELIDLCNEMFQDEEKYIVLKKNAGKFQENIKFPTEYRNKLNIILSQMFGEEQYDFSKIHSNSLLINEESVDENEEEGEQIK